MALMSPDACCSCVLMWSARDVMMLVRAALHAALNARLSDGSPVRRYRRSALGFHGLIWQHVRVVLTAAATAASSQRRVNFQYSCHIGIEYISIYSSASDCCDPYSHECRMSRPNACLSMRRSARYVNDIVTGDGGGGTRRRQVTRRWSEKQTDYTATADINWPRADAKCCVFHGNRTRDIYTSLRVKLHLRHKTKQTNKETNGQTQGIEFGAFYLALKSDIWCQYFNNVSW